jgi:hypothetical protein
MKLVFLFMIYDIIEKEDLWLKFFKDADTTKYNIYIHAKDNSKVNLSNDLKKFLLDKNYPTGWGNFSLVYLQNRLLEESIKDPQSYKFIFLSGSHIPLHDFNNLYKFLTANDNSYFHFFQINRQSELFKNRICSINNIKNYSLYGWVYASQWAILNRKQSEFILKNEKEFNIIFEKSKFPDEFAYINYLFENRFIKNIVNIKTTYFSFVPSFNSKYRPIPHTFDLDELNFNIIKNIKKSYLFMRKISNTCIIDPSWIFYDINFKLDNNVKLKKHKEIEVKVKEISNKIKII